MSTSTAFAGPWSSLPTPLTPWILDVIQSLGHSQMTPVQASTIPLFMKHKDVVVEAVTGSGKTLAFVVPILERLARRESKLKKNEIGALVISPTRELAAQTHSIFSLFLSAQPTFQSGTPPRSSDTSTPNKVEHPLPLLLVASAQSSPTQDVQRFISTGADIIIGTPGRVEEFLLGKGRPDVTAKELEVLVLDEADRLLDLGFQSTLTRILSHLPKQRRTGLFSATMTDTDALAELIRVGLRNPARIVVRVQRKLAIGKNGTGNKNKIGEAIEERRIPANLQNLYLTCRASEKLVQLLTIIAHEMAQHQSAQFIVYFATCACVDYFYRILPRLLPSAKMYSLHGHIPPDARTRALASFSSSLSTPASPSVLLATDVVARGLDLPHVDVVIQFDPPADPRAFSHRCGRTARAGRSGRAWVLLVGREVEFVDFMAVRKIPLKEHPRFAGHPHSPSECDEPQQEAPEVTSLLDRIRKIVLEDRALHDKATKAFVSFVRAYSKHEASYIFRVKDLDLIGTARCFGLLRLPRMPELQHSSRSRWEDAIVDWDSYVYRDKAQESKRLLSKASTATGSDKAQEKRQVDPFKKTKSSLSWSHHREKKEEREKRKEKKDRKRNWLKMQQDTQPGLGGASNQTSKREGPEHSEGEWEELAREERLAKKLRKGDISREIFDKEFLSL